MNEVGFIWNNHKYYLPVMVNEQSSFLYAPYSTSPKDFSIRKRMETLFEIKNMLSSEFPLALVQLMKLQRVSVNELATRLNLSTTTISNLRRQQRRVYEKDLIVAIAASLHLPPMLSYHLLQTANILVGCNTFSLKHQLIIDQLYTYSFPDIQQILVREGFKQLLF